MKRHVTTTASLTKSGKTWKDGPLIEDPARADHGMPIKFECDTGKRQAHAYKRVLDPDHPLTGGALTSERIRCDINRCMGHHLVEIFKEDGAVVHGLGSVQKGWRKEARSKALAATGVSPKRRGGLMIKKGPESKKWYHPDAAKVRAANTAKSVAIARRGKKRPASAQAPARPRRL